MTISFVYSLLYSIIVVVVCLLMFLYSRNKDTFNKNMTKVLILILILPWMMSLIYINNLVSRMTFMILYAVAIVMIIIVIGVFAKKAKIFTIDKGEEFVCLSKIVSISVVIFVTVIWLIACFEAAETVLMLQEKYR